MRYINDEYVSVFKDCITETSRQEGYTLPEDIEAYVAILLGSFIDEPDFLPNPTFIEAYMNGTMPSKDLADVCLFVRGVFPTHGTRYGLDKTYYSKIGKSCYENAGEFLHPELFGQLALHFDFLGDFIELTVNPNTEDSFLE